MIELIGLSFSGNQTSPEEYDSEIFSASSIVSSSMSIRIQYNDITVYKYDLNSTRPLSYVSYRTTLER
jgi:hypothetical protein